MIWLCLKPPTFTTKLLYSMGKWLIVRWNQTPHLSGHSMPPKNVHWLTTTVKYPLLTTSQQKKKTLFSIGISRNYDQMGHLYHSYICQWYSHVKSPKAMSSEKHDWLVVSTPLKNMKVSWDDYSQYMEK